MKPLPMAPSCALDEDGLRQQYERYRAVGRGARVLEHSPQRLVVQLQRGAAGSLVEETLEVERACCPFFDLQWDPQDLRLTVSVSLTEHEPALDAIVFALGLNDGQRS